MRYAAGSKLMENRRFGDWGSGMANPLKATAVGQRPSFKHDQSKPKDSGLIRKSGSRVAFENQEKYDKEEMRCTSKFCYFFGCFALLWNVLRLLAKSPWIFILVESKRSSSLCLVRLWRRRTVSSEKNANCARVFKGNAFMFLRNLWLVFCKHFFLVSSS